MMRNNDERTHQWNNIMPAELEMKQTQEWYEVSDM